MKFLTFTTCYLLGKDPEGKSQFILYIQTIQERSNAWKKMRAKQKIVESLAAAGNCFHSFSK